MALKQHVTLEVHDSYRGGNLEFATSGLRVDFDIRNIPGFSKGKVTIYNLNNSTITSLMSGDRYITIKTRLHDGQEYTLMNRFLLNNAVDELKLPDRITTLYCFSSIRNRVLEKQVNLTIEKPSLERMVRQMLKNAEHSGPVDFKSFPSGSIENEGKRKTRTLQGSVQQCFRRLEKEYGFNTYTDEGGIVLMYKPNLSNVKRTTLDSKTPDVELQTAAMRSNPKIGIGTAQIVSNLDPHILPSTVLDLSQLLTVGVDAPDEDLELIDNYLSNFSSYSKYQAFAVQHKGSNYTAEWSTTVTALSPSEGTLMPTVAWASTSTT
jgi:hypothetical protein